MRRHTERAASSSRESASSAFPTSGMRLRMRSVIMVACISQRVESTSRRESIRLRILSHDGKSTGPLVLARSQSSRSSTHLHPSSSKEHLLCMGTPLHLRAVSPKSNFTLRHCTVEFAYRAEVRSADSGFLWVTPDTTSATRGRLSQRSTSGKQVFSLHSGGVGKNPGIRNAARLLFENRRPPRSVRGIVLRHRYRSPLDFSTCAGRKATGL